MKRATRAVCLGSDVGASGSLLLSAKQTQVGHRAMSEKCHFRPKAAEGTALIPINTICADPP
jgi:hypothetical protein